MVKAQRPDITGGNGLGQPVMYTLAMMFIMHLCRETERSRHV
jgi:hypothetical protein